MSSEYSALKPFLCSSLDPALLRSEWEKWKRAFNIFADATDIKEQSKLKSKLLHFGGIELQEVFFSIPGADEKQNEEGTIKVFDIAIEKLDAQFSPPRNSIFERHIFRTMMPDDGETFDRFLVRLRKQAEKCCFGKTADESREINLKDKIIEIAPVEVKRKLLQEELSLDQMISMYVVHSQINAQTSQMGRSKIEYNSVNKITTEFDRVQAKQRSFKCYKCDGMGHYAYECKKNVRRNNGYLKTTVRCEKCSKLGHTKENCWSRGNFDRYSNKNGKRKYANGNKFFFLSRVFF